MKRSPKKSKSENVAGGVTDKLHQAAVKVRKNSYSPYSGYKVASALVTDDNRIFAGVNVENASYGGTICAERSAIFTAVSSGAKKIKAILVLTDEKTPWPPCGFCRQVISEFVTKDTTVYLANLSGVKKAYKFSELFPTAFSL